ncbi:hypothetical protein ACFTWS_36530 [Streptomyces sp. NPDC057027]|uniref:hypothetical protein n=1 Tax=Streptomyces sp. NPDC057027 TaxID=3346004 RepID=UPI0036264114
MTAVTAVFTAVLAVTCGGTANASGYDWADPISSVCSNDAYTARSSALLDNDEQIGTIENAQWSAAKGQYYCYTAMLNDAGYLSYAEGYATASGRYGWDQTITGSY